MKFEWGQEEWIYIGLEEVYRGVRRGYGVGSGRGLKEVKTGYEGGQNGF